MQKSSSNNSFNKNEVSTVSTNSQIQSTVSTATNGTSVASTADVQAQFELLVELRRFINIDLFQRGYYQIRVSIKCGNKQVPIKVILQLENNKNNLNLSGESGFQLAHDILCPISQHSRGARNTTGPREGGVHQVD